MASITCPHCGAANVAGAAFCESCGKALPAASPSGPRVVTGDVMPTSAAGTALLTDQLVKQQKQASTALLVVAVLQLVCGALGIVILSVVRGQGAAAANNPAMGNLTLFMAVQLGVAAIFFGLYFWSRKSPLPASIVGLCLYATLVAINVVVTLGSIKENEGRGGVGVGILDIIIIVILARAIQAGLKHKRILEQQQMSPGYPPVMPPPLR